VQRLRDLHELGDDPAFERFPATDELLLVLEHAQRWAGNLKQPGNTPVNVSGEAAVLRVKLWQYLREQADAGQLKAIEHGRAAGVPWQHFTEALCVTSKQGAFQKAQRLKAEQVREPGERRTPEVAREHADRAAAEERAERAMIIAQERRFPAAQHITRLLLEQRDDLTLDDMAAYWLSELTKTIDDRDNPAKRARFTSWLEALVRAIQGHARESGRPPATTDEARRALALATDFTHQERPEIPRQTTGEGA